MSFECATSVVYDPFAGFLFRTYSRYIKVRDSQGFVDISELSPKLDYLLKVAVTFEWIIGVKGNSTYLLPTDRT